MAKKKAIRKKKRTLSEFRAWLEGVEELQGEDWSPSAEQWKLIRAAIDGIVEEQPEQPAPAMRQEERHNPLESQTSNTPSREYMPPPQQEFTPPPPPPNTSSLADVEMTPEAKAVLGGGGVPKHLQPDSSGKLQTPNVDTSNGEYNTSFE